ncbi:MAG: flagellar protein FlgN [Gammaproteobacteria bacterium]|nr:flagellar protein FlgN [Gammaproteobacteria bacterium]
MSQMLIQQCHDALKVLLNRQTVEITALNDYLDEIRTAISEGDITALNNLVSRDKLPLAEIEDLESQRDRLLEVYGFDSGQQALKKCISWCDSDQIIAQQYEKFHQSLLYLQRAIQLNSLILNKGQQRVRRGLHLLTGRTDSENAKTYSSDGQTREKSFQRHLAQA